MTKQTATQQALAWSRRVDLPAYIYTSPRGWLWTTDKTIAHMASATVEIVDANPVRVGARALRAIPSERRRQASRENGRKGPPESHRRGGRPRKTSS